MKYLASSNKKVLLPVILVFAFISLFFIFQLSNSNSHSQPTVDHDGVDATVIENTAMVESMELTKSEWESCLSPGETPTEYLSIVIVTRVDDYAG